MKKFAALLILAVFVLGIGAVLAQDTNDNNNTVTIVIAVPDILVICPGDYVLPTVREAAELVVEFSALNETITLPYANIVNTDNGQILEIGFVELNCETAPEQVAAEIDRSPTVNLNEDLPQPENPIGLASTQAGYLIVNSPNVNLRSCDHPNCSRVGIVHGGDELIVIGRNEAANWWYVEAGDVRGWIFADLVVIRGDLTGTAIVETEGEPTAPSVYIGYTGNLIYDVLSLQGAGICAVQGGQEYPLIARNSDTTWVWIEAQCVDGTIVQGWMNADSVAIRNTGEVFVPIVGAEGPETE